MSKKRDENKNCINNMPKIITPLIEETTLDELKIGDVFMHFEKNEDYAVKFDVVEMVDYCNPKDIFIAAIKRDDNRGAGRKSYPLKDMDKSIKYYKESTAPIMTIKQATDVLKKYNKWRRGEIKDNIERVNPALYGKAIDTVTEFLDVIFKKLEL